MNTSLFDRSSEETKNISSGQLSSGTNFFKHAERVTGTIYQFMPIIFMAHRSFFVILSSNMGNSSQIWVNLHQSWPTDRCYWHRLIYVCTWKWITSLRTISERLWISSDANRQQTNSPVIKHLNYSFSESTRQFITVCDSVQNLPQLSMFLDLFYDRQVYFLCLADTGRPR